MKILVACEESQAVTKELRALGHEAYSCDIIECSGGHPEWHIKGDALKLINKEEKVFYKGKYVWVFNTQDDSYTKVVEEWDMIIAFPPCTYLTNAGTRHFSLKCSTPEKIEKRIALRKEAAEFFMKFANADAESENDKENYHKKRTCLWLKGLPLLKRKNHLPKPQPMYICQGEKCKGKAIGWCEGMRNIKGGQEERAKARSKTFPGIAKAMAQQWGGKCTN